MANPNTTSLHLVKHEVVQAAIYIEDTLTSLYDAIIQSIIQNLPSFLQNTKCTLNILLDALQIWQKISLERRILNAAVGTNQCQPAQIAIVADYIHTLILFESAFCSAIPPTNILISTHSNVMNVSIVLNNLLVILCTKLWTIDGTNPAIEIGNALKSKTGIPSLTLCTIVIASWTWWPLDMNHNHWSAAARQAGFLVVLSNLVQLRNVHRQQNVLIPHFMHHLKEGGKEFSNFWSRYLTKCLTGAKRSSCPQAVQGGHDNNSDRSQNSDRRINDLAGFRYPQLMKISESSSIFDSGIWNQFQSLPYQSEVDSSCVRLWVIPGFEILFYTNRIVWHSFCDEGVLDDASCGNDSNDVQTPHSSQQRIKRRHRLVRGIRNKQQTTIGHVAHITIPLKFAAKVEGGSKFSLKIKREGIVIKTVGQHSREAQ